MKLTPYTSLGGLLLISFFLISCSHNMTTSELTSNTKKIIFVQHGEAAQLYKLGMHDGASFWSNDSGIIGAVASMINIDIHSKATITLKNLMKQNNLISDTSKAIHQALQKKWHKQFYNKEPIIIKNNSLKYNANGDLYTGGSDADITIIFSVNHIELTAVASVGNMLGDIVTLGFQDKDVSPIIRASIIAYKKNRQKKYAELAWAISCQSGTFSSPEEYTVKEMQKDKKKAYSLFKIATDMLISDCVDNIMDS